MGAATSASQTGDTPTSTFNFNGGTLRVRASGGNFFQGNAASPFIPIAAIVKSGGAVIDSAKFDITFAEPLVHDPALGATADGSLTKLGSGILRLFGNNTFTGGTLVNIMPTNIIAVANGGNLDLSWPSDHVGWRLQVQTNSLATGLGTNWSDVPGSAAVDNVSLPMGKDNGAVFFRLVYP